MLKMNCFKFGSREKKESDKIDLNTKERMGD